MPFGKGFTDKFLSEADITGILSGFFSAQDTAGKKILAIIPDSTRSGPTGFFFRQFCELLGGKCRKLDFLVALGTHPEMSPEKISAFLGIPRNELDTRYKNHAVINHRWDDPAALVPLGTISAEEIERISGGLFSEEVPVEINKLVLEYDLLVIYGPVFPHEVVGFSGGHKYLFPGIAGRRIIDFFHWLGAVITNVRINGVKDTPTRKVVEKAASFLKTPCLCVCSVIGEDRVRGVFAGVPQEAWSQAADLSAKVHIVCKEKPYAKVLGIAPAMYDDLWTAGKVMYKLESIVRDGGELIIYAPHITEVSYTHGGTLDKIGYHVRDYFLKQQEKFSGIPGGIRAHSTHVKGTGTFEGGIEKPRIIVTLATGIPEERCKKINLGYRDPAKIDITQWLNREDEGVLVVDHAGEILHRLRG